MSITVSASGTQTATVTTSHTLSGPTAAGVYQLLVDASALVVGDTLELRIEAKVLTGGTKRIMFASYYSGPQDDPIKLSPPVTLPFGGDFILKQVAGTSRDFPWALIALA